MTQRYITIPIAVVALYLSLFILPGLGSPILGNSVMPVTLLLILLFGDTAVAIIGALIAGGIMDIVSPFPFGMYIVSFCSSVLITHWVFHIRFTNRSLIAYLSLTAFGCGTVSLIASCYSMLLSAMGIPAIALPFTMSQLLTIGFDAFRATLLALIVYLIVRVTGRSYATLVSQEF